MDSLLDSKHINRIKNCSLGWRICCFSYEEKEEKTFAEAFFVLKATFAVILFVFGCSFWHNYETLPEFEDSWRWNLRISYISKTSRVWRDSRHKNVRTTL